VNCEEGLRGGCGGFVDFGVWDCSDRMGDVVVKKVALGVFVEVVVGLRGSVCMIKSCCGCAVFV